MSNQTVPTPPNLAPPSNITQSDVNLSQPNKRTDEQKANLDQNEEENEEYDQPVDHGLKSWSEDPQTKIPLLHGLRNEDVWQLVRRFNKQIYHIKTIDQQIPQGGIDLNIADKDEFFPDKLRSTLERVYMTIGLGLAAFFKHIARVRSWKETQRTLGFFVGFLVIWYFNFFISALFSLIAIVLAFPTIRSVLFPHAPLATISAKTGQAKVPKAGHLGSESLTGAAESYKGEAVEQEASNVVESVAHLAVSTAINNDSAKVQNHESVKDEEENSEDDDEKNLDPASTLTKSGKEAQKQSNNSTDQIDPSADPIKQSIWASTQPFLHALEDAADTWERLGNALKPTYPYSKHGPRLFMAGIVAPLALLALFVPVELVYRSTTLLIGLLFFGQPVIDKMKISTVRQWLDKNIPDWQRYLELRNSILKGVPTNAQLTLTLLRIGEANKSPLPPPPPSSIAPAPTAKERDEIQDEVPEEYQEDLKEHQREIEQEEQQEQQEEKTSNKKKGSKILALFKGGIKAGTETALGTNRVKAEIGFERAKQKVGVVHLKNVEQYSVGDGPASFHGRHHGKRGLALISTTATTPCLSFERSWPAHAKAAHAAYMKAKEIQQDGDDENGDENEPGSIKLLRDAAEKARPAPLFSIQVDDIISLKKIGGLGWKGKLVVGWALDTQVTDGIEIQTKDEQTYVLTALPRRDELFNRLASMGKEQRWEAW